MNLMLDSTFLLVPERSGFGVSKITNLCSEIEFCKKWFPEDWKKKSEYVKAQGNLFIDSYNIETEVLSEMKKIPYVKRAMKR